MKKMKEEGIKSSKYRLGILGGSKLLLLSTNLLLLAIMSFVKFTKCVNLITSFPENLYVSKDDKVGFLLTKFVNGTRV